MENNKLNFMIKKIGELPSLPPLVSKIISVSEDERATITDISKIIATDLGVASKVLKLANSAYFGFPREIATLSQAVLILGIETIKSIVLGISVFSSFGKKKTYYEDFVLICKHAFLVADFSREFSRQIGYSEPEEGFIAGLLHDLGKIVILKYLPEEYSRINSMVVDEHTPLLTAEKNVLGLTHSEIGREIAVLWNLPDKIVLPIQYHHTPYDIDPLDAEEYEKNAILIKLVCLANMVYDRQDNTADTPRSFPEGLYERLLDELKIPQLYIEEILENQPSRLSILQEIFATA